MSGIGNQGISTNLAKILKEADVNGNKKIDKSETAFLEKKLNDSDLTEKDKAIIKTLLKSEKGTGSSDAICSLDFCDSQTSIPGKEGNINDNMSKFEAKLKKEPKEKITSDDVSELFNSMGTQLANSSMEEAISFFELAKKFLAEAFPDKSPPDLTGIFQNCIDTGKKTSEAIKTAVNAVPEY